MSKRVQNLEDLTKRLLKSSISSTSASTNEPLLAGIKSLSGPLKQLVVDYLRRQQNTEFKKHVEKLVIERNVIELNSLLSQRLEFGTAGIRGRMGPGNCQLNELTIIQIGQGLASYLLDHFGPKIQDAGVAIGHDARHNSQKFARLITICFLQKKIPVFFNDYIIPTPLLAYSVRSYNCCAGVMVTASHNPKEDNGIKVYWDNGALISTPHDARIQAYIVKQENLEPWPNAWEHWTLQIPSLLSESQPSFQHRPPSPGDGTTPVRFTPSASCTLKYDSDDTNPLPVEWVTLVKRSYGQLCKRYFTYINSICPTQEQQSRNKAANLVITYTPMHGVGHIFMTRALEIGGFEDIYPVELQRRPDPDFTTVKYPNPEEAGALDLAFETAKQTRSNLILANDPDSDRCGVAIYNPDTGDKRIFNGNEIGTLLGWWLWHLHKLKITKDRPSRPGSGSSSQQIRSPSPTTLEVTKHYSPPGTPVPPIPSSLDMAYNPADLNKKPAPLSDCYMISTAVSTKFLQTMARQEGFNFVETLTGFKNIANIADDLVRKHQKHVLFAFEEALGYMVDPTVLDKDGISACLQIAQAAAYCQTAYRRDLNQQLEWLHARYGYHYNINSYFKCNDVKKIRQIFNQIQAGYPKEFVVSDLDKDQQEKRVTYTVQRVRDLNKPYDSGTSNHQPVLPTNSNTFMVTFFIDKDITITLRDSGTEPKIKYYSEIVAVLSPRSSYARHLIEKGIAQRRLKLCLDAVLKKCVRAHEYGLEHAEEAKS